MKTKRFSKDPKVSLITIEDFFERTNYLTDYSLECFLNEKRPIFGTIYYKVTSKYLILIEYGLTTINFGLDDCEKLKSIYVALRDGKTEYKLIDLKLKSLIEINKREYNKNIAKLIENINDTKQFLLTVKFNSQTIIENLTFEDYIINIDYKLTKHELINQFVVIDVETNGLRRQNDDLLSVSIFDPSTGKCYNRFLPLDLQPLVLTGWINGINDEDLENKSHITQEELDRIIEYFDLKNRIILSYSGGNGTFDSSFIINYCKRHNLTGFENLQYQNIKSFFPSSQYGIEGKLTKDNLCKLLNISGTNKIHTSINDCILEWKLFEYVYTEKLFFINNKLFNYHDGYIVPISYLIKNPELAIYAGIDMPYIEGIAKCVFNYKLPSKVVKKTKKFPTNITGIALENGINHALNVEKQDNFKFLSKNKSSLDYLGTLESNFDEIPIDVLEDGTIKSFNPKFEDYINDVNNVTSILINSIEPVISFIKEQIFNNKKILSQELSISKDKKILAICDLSNSESILEVKTYDIGFFKNKIDNNLAKQLYYESNGRNAFVLEIKIITHNGKRKIVTDSINVNIFSVKLNKTTPENKEYVKTLWGYEEEVLELIRNNPSITNVGIAKIIGGSPNFIGRIIKTLKELKYIIKEDESKKSSKWIILRKKGDIKTKYLLIDGNKQYIFKDNKVHI